MYLGLKTNCNKQRYQDTNYITYVYILIASSDLVNELKKLFMFDPSLIHRDNFTDNYS
jgi:hypothetical protein